MLLPRRTSVVMKNNTAIANKISAIAIDRFRRLAKSSGEKGSGIFGWSITAPP
jgi:hypothetical protein